MKERATTLIVLLLTLLLGVGAVGQDRLPVSSVVAFYNTENLFDTIPALFYDDSDYTPCGRLMWNSERYGRKIEALSKVLDALSADLVGLAEVENEGVVRDVVQKLQNAYCYVHRTSSDRRGIDVALLYRGEKFFVERVSQLDLGTSREALCVVGELNGQRVDVVVWHAPSRLNGVERRESALKNLRRAVDSLRVVDHGARVVVMGDMNSSPDERLFRYAFGRHNNGLFADSQLFSPVMCNKGLQGSYCSDVSWLLFDNILVDSRMLTEYGHIEGGVFVREWMLADKGDGQSVGAGAPLRTFTSGQYTGGASDHLPVFAIFVDNNSGN